jgi:hypothetical protein
MPRGECGKNGLRNAPLKPKDGLNGPPAWLAILIFSLFDLAQAFMK